MIKNCIILINQFNKSVNKSIFTEMSSETLQQKLKEPANQAVPVITKQKKHPEIVVIHSGSNNVEMVTTRDNDSEKHESSTEIIFNLEKNKNSTELVPSFSYIPHWQPSIILPLFFLLIQLLMLSIFILSKYSVKYFDVNFIFH
jgi:hypothetical protein